MSMSVLLSIFEIVSFKKKKNPPAMFPGRRNVGIRSTLQTASRPARPALSTGNGEGAPLFAPTWLSLLPCGGCSEVWSRSACGWRNGTVCTSGSVCRPGSTARPRGLGTRSANWQVTRTAGLAGRGWARGRWPHPSRFHIKCIFQDLDFHTCSLRFHPLGANSHS